MTKISLADDELMTTDSERRILTIRPMHRSDLQIHELTETFWTFTPGPMVDIGGVIKCTGEHCTQHCKSHCKNHCFQHCIDHPGPPKDPKLEASPGDPFPLPP
jgi:hypothetical protein